MTLPTMNSRMDAPVKGTMGAAMLRNPPVTKDNSNFIAKHGNATWQGNDFKVSGEGLVNYWYVPAVQDQVSYCVVHCNGAGDAYVISDQYGGCELHELYNEDFKLLAFLHVWRGGGGTAAYTPAPGWKLRSVKRSAEIAKAGGMGATNWSFTHINRSTNPPTVQSKFISVKGMPPLSIVREDSGDSPY